MVSLEKDILKSAQRIDALKNKMNALASVKAPTQEYQEISKQIADAEKKQASLNDRMSKFIELGGKTNSKQFKSMQYDAAELENTIRYAKGELQDLVDTGKAFTLGDSTSEFNNLSQQLSAEQSKLNDLTSRYQKAQNVAEMADRFEQVGGAAKTAFSVAKDGAVTASEAIAKMGVSLGGAAKRLASFAGKAVLHLSGIKGASKTSGNAVERLGKRVLSLAKTVFVFGILRRALTAFKNGIQDGFGTYLEYDTSLKNAISGLKAQLNGLKGSLASAFAPIVSAIVPYLSTLISWLTAASNAIAQFIAVLTGHTSYKKAVANVGAVGAAADGAAGSLGSAAKAAEDLEKALGDYDELKVIEQPKDSGSGGGGGGGAGSAGDITYEEVDVSTAVSDFAEKVKQAWEKSDFTEVGAIIGDKLNDALENIPWDGIQQTAKNIGKDVATLINGFIEVDDLGSNIGSTIAEAINTGILGLESFSSDLHWDSVGKFVSDGITGTLNTIQWDNLQTTADNLGTGLAVALNGIMTDETFGSIGESFAKAVRAVVSGAHSFVKKSDFKGWGTAIGTSINNFFDGVNWKEAGLTFSGAVNGILNTLKSAVKTINWSGVGTSIAEALKTVPWADLLKSAADLVGSIFAGLLDFGSAVLTRLGTSEWENFLVDVRESTKSLSLANDEIERRIASASEWAEAGEEYDYAHELADEYFDLQEKQSLSNDEKDRMKELAGELVETIPQLETYYNKETGLLDTTRSSVDNLIESLKAKARTEAAQDALKEFYKAQMDAKESMDKTKESLAPLQEAYDELNEKYQYYSELEQNAIKNGELLADGNTEYSSALNSVKAEMLKVEQQMETLNDEYDRANQSYQDAQTEIDRVTGYLVSYSDEAKTATSETDKLRQGLKNLSTNSKFTINLKGLDASFEEKLEIIAEVTGIDYSKTPVSDKYIDDCYAEIVRAYQNPGYTPQLYGANAIMTSATDRINQSDKTISAKANYTTAQDSLTADKKTIETKSNYTSSSDGLSKSEKTIETESKYTSADKNSLPVNDKIIGTIAEYIDARKGSLSESHKIIGTIAKFIDTKKGELSESKKTIGTIAEYIDAKKGSLSSGEKTISVVAKYTSIIDALTTAMKTIAVAVTAAASTKKAEGGVYQSGTWSDLPQKALGGIKQTNFWKSIPQFASGGSPHGTMFIAGEAGPEIVGHVGGRTEVLNKSQIASAIYSAVCSAMRESINALGYAVLSHMTDCTNMVIANMAEIAADMRRTMDMSMPKIQYAGIPAGYMPDVNRINAVYQSVPSSAQMIDYDKLASAVANKISWNMQLENVTYLDRDVVYQSMVEVDREMINQTGHSGFGV